MGLITTNEVYVTLKKAAEDEDRQAAECRDRGNIMMSDVHTAIATVLFKMAVEFYEQSLEE